MLKYLGTIKKSSFTHPTHKWVVSSEEHPFRKFPTSGEGASRMIRKIRAKGENPTIYKLVD